MHKFDETEACYAYNHKGFRGLDMAQSYLVLNQSGYYFRIVVPVDLRSMIGMREIKRSLKTGVLGLAKEKARLLAGKIQRLYRALREDKMSQPDQKKIQELVHTQIFLIIRESIQEE